MEGVWLDVIRWFYRWRGHTQVRSTAFSATLGPYQVLKNATVVRPSQGSWEPSALNTQLMAWLCPLYFWNCYEIGAVRLSLTVKMDVSTLTTVLISAFIAVLTALISRLLSCDANITAWHWINLNMMFGQARGLIIGFVFLEILQILPGTSQKSNEESFLHCWYIPCEYKFEWREGHAAKHHLCRSMLPLWRKHSFKCCRRNCNTRGKYNS